MKLKTLIASLLLCTAITLAVPSSALADKWVDDMADRVFEKYKDRDDRDKSEREKSFSLDQAVNKIRRSKGGKIIGAKTRKEDGRPMHFIKVHSDDGRVRTYRVDGRTGQIK